MRYLKTISALLMALAFLAGAFSACSQKQAREEVKARSPRVVSLAPNLTEIVFALGMGDHLVGVTEHCNYPPEAKTKPKLGGLKNINIEAVLAQEPDLVLATRDGNELELLDKLSELGLKVRSYQPENLDQVLDTILEVGIELDRKEQAQKLVADLEKQKQLIEKSVKDAPAVPVFLFFQREPLIAAGAGSFANDLIKKAGGVNLAEDARIPYPHYSLEIVLEKFPEVIIDVSMSEFPGAQAEAERWWGKWRDIPAVKNHRIYVLNSDLITRPGPRLFQGLLELAKILHPERFQGN